MVPVPLQSFHVFRLQKNRPLPMTTTMIHTNNELAHILDLFRSTSGNSFHLPPNSIQNKYNNIREKSTVHTIPDQSVLPALLPTLLYGSLLLQERARKKQPSGWHLHNRCAPTQTVDPVQWPFQNNEYPLQLMPPSCLHRIYP